MKPDAQMTQEILREVKKRRAQRKKRMTILGPALSVILIGALAFGLWRGGALPISKGEPTPEIGADSTVDPSAPRSTEPATVAGTTLQPAGETSAAVENDGGAAIDPTTTTFWNNLITTEGASNSVETTVAYTSDAASFSTTMLQTTDPHLTGGRQGIALLPRRPASEKLERKGEKLTDKQAAAYFKENLTWLQSALAASGVAADDLHVSARGYCHVSFDAVGEPYYEMTTEQGCVGGRESVCILQQNFRDYLLYNGDELVAIVTLVLEDGEIYATPAFGGDWFKPFGEFLQSHAGEELLFLYFGQQAFVLTPGGEVRNPLGRELAPDFGGIEDPYRFFYCKDAIHVP